MLNFMQHEMACFRCDETMSVHCGGWYVVLMFHWLRLLTKFAAALVPVVVMAGCCGQTVSSVLVQWGGTYCT